MPKKSKSRTNSKSEVGYGKPPVETRFAKGKSGNPRGRPKGRLNLATILANAASETMVVTQDGKRTKLSRLDVTVRQMFLKGAGGDLRAASMIFALASYLENDDGAARSPDLAMDRQHAKDYLKRLLERQQPNGEGGGDHENN